MSVTISESFNPYDEELKTRLHPKADKTNVVGIRNGTPVLLCGAIKRGKPCRSAAGHGTDHRGYGRCRLHGGNSTGPKSAAGKAASSQNNRKHGFYSLALAPDEREAYETLLADKAVSVVHEINMLKAKILVYLKKWQAKIAEDGEAAAKVEYNTVTEGENGDTVNIATNYYHAASIEDRPLLRALETLGRLVDKHAKLNPEAGDDLISQINAELRAASHGKVTMSWSNRQAQSKTTADE